MVDIRCSEEIKAVFLVYPYFFPFLPEPIGKVCNQFNHQLVYYVKPVISFSADPGNLAGRWLTVHSHNYYYRMPIIYSVIARGSTVLAEYAAPRSGNVPSVAKDILTKLGMRDEKKTYAAEGVCFHCLVTRGIAFLCVASQDFGSIRPFAFLQSIAQGKYPHGSVHAYLLNNCYTRLFCKIWQQSEYSWSIGNE